MNDPVRLFDVASLLGAGVDRPERAAPTDYARVRRGIYTSATSWKSLSIDDRYRHTVLASARTLTGSAVFSHESSAVLLGLPVLGAWPESVHLIAARASGGRSQRDVVRHCIGLEAVREHVVDGVAVTSPARTVFDLAIGRSFARAIVVADAAFPAFPECESELSDLIRWWGRRRGHLKLRRVAAFADAAAQSVGESWSRVQIDVAEFLRPMLQYEVTSEGHRDITDFAWPTVRGVGEFDGEVKYREDRYRSGRSAEDVVVSEKTRENRIRRTMHRFARWDMRDLRQPGRLEAILSAAGIPRSAR